MGQITRNELAPVLTAELDTFDTTGENTSLDTKNVNGVPATTITQKITQAETDITALKEVDTTLTGKISQAETTLATKADVSTFNAHVGDNTKHLTERLFPHCKSITDWNEARENGYYMGANVSNAPGADWFMGIVTAHNDIWCEQRIIGFNASPRKEYVRRLMNNSWTAWENVSPGNLDALQFGSKTDIATSLNELFQYADNGKNLVRNAVIGKDVWVNANPTFQELANGVNSISTGLREYIDASWFNNSGGIMMKDVYQSPANSWYGLGSAQVYDLLYIMGGYAGGNYTTTVKAFNVKTGTYTNVTSMKTGVPNPTLDSMDGLLYVYFSTGSFGIFNTNTWAWTYQTYSGLASITSVVTDEVNKQVYFYASTNVRVQYNPSVGTFSTVSATAGDGLTARVHKVNGKTYLHKTTTTSYTATGTFYEYDMNNNTVSYSSFTNVPPGHWGGNRKAVSIKNKLITLEHSLNSLDRVMVCDLSNNTYKFIEGVYYRDAALAVDGNKVYLIGSAKGLTPSDTSSYTKQYIDCAVIS